MEMIVKLFNNIQMGTYINHIENWNHLKNASHYIHQSVYQMNIKTTKELHLKRTLKLIVL